MIVVIGAPLVWKPQIDPIEPPQTTPFNSKLVIKGAQLADIGNCAVCHTTPGGKAYAGSRALPTPFGTIYSSNITPDAETGIGNWSEEAFRRALRDGIDRKGRHLYPAFPYDHFTHLTDDETPSRKKAMKIVFSRPIWSEVRCRLLAQSGHS
jgi:hypothetical protein